MCESPQDSLPQGTLNVLEIKQYMHECQKLDLFDLDAKLMTSVGPVYKQQETSSRYCVANDNMCNVRRHCKLLMLQKNGHHLLAGFCLWLCRFCIPQNSSTSLSYSDHPHRDGRKGKNCLSAKKQNA
jgi:hypothetical protein